MFVIHAEYAGNPTTTETAVGRAITLLDHLDTNIPFTVEGNKQIIGVIADPINTLKAIKLLANLTHWKIGVGIGALEKNKAHTHAQRALKKSRTHATNFALNTGPKNEITQSLEALIRLKIHLISERTARQKQIIALREQATTQTDVANQTGVSKAAISKVLKAANWEIETQTDTLTIRLLEGLNR